ncbi:carbamoyltransferase C-terminal domain-containing protein [Streptomyces sp. TLI_146]|uniref:carbamoyltransferase family protein n=1 Tax=Streptomyces sp. TLI_146 TaxID=1938858 RepID=UPI000C705C47|nr:carbamoyltransferase C-terminal domain-containing protein [Streptomyces sp. TLI_146]PKV84231.1 carbamoyltransferase [Streptomyces sp. TLI_146]
MKSVVLGLCSGTHDSAAALITEGRLVGLVEEERLNSIKHTKAYPAAAVDWLLDTAGISPGDVTDVAYNFAPRLYLLGALPLGHLRPATARRAVPRARSFFTVTRRAAQRLHGFGEHFPHARRHGVEHHRAHGLYAFGASPFEEAAVLIVDSLGETVTTSMCSARRTPGGIHMHQRWSLHDPASLGYAYGAVTEHLGWRRGDEEGTVMALAALGDPARFRDLFAQAIVLTEEAFALNPAWFPLRVISSRYPRLSAQFVEATCPSRAPEEEVAQVHADLAAALQERTEQVMVHLARRARRRTGQRALCVGGGVALNCVSLGRIVAEAGYDEVFVPPSPGDAGTAAGAALSVWQRHTPAQVEGIQDACYLGPAFSGITLVERPRPGMWAHRPADAVRHLASELAAGTIVGLFRGALEAGPRALGNRSILASPLRPEVVGRLNARVKFREPFRPFAPVVLADKAADYFTLGQAAPYMSFASGVTPLARETIPAIVHANGLARIQTLTPERNPFLDAVLRAFHEITGAPVLINTSLNIKGKPICGTPDQALDCLAESGIDALLLEDWWVQEAEE